MIAIQIVAILFALWMIYFTFLHFRRGEFSKSELVIWQILWFGLVFVVIYPSSIKFLLTALNISRTFDLIVIVGIIVLYGITFRNYVIARRLERKIEQVVRDESLQIIK